MWPQWDCFQTHHSNTGKSCAQKQIPVVILYKCECSVLQEMGWVVYRILLKGVLVRFAKSYVRSCFGNGQGSGVAGLGDLQRSNSNHSDVGKPVSCPLSSSQWAAHVSKEKESYFNSRFFDVL